MVATRRSSAGAKAEEPKRTRPPPAVTQPGFWRSFATRAKAALAMMVCFLCILWAGHFYVWLLILFLQVLSFRELLNVRYQDYKKDTEKAMPLFRTLQWGWFYAAQFYVYADFVHEFALQNHTQHKLTQPFSRYWEAISFFLYCVVFTLSVYTLRVDAVRYQVGQLSWTIVTLCIVVGQMKFVAHNIFEGLFWFFFPVWLVVHNDCWAYAWGALLGRRFITQPFFSLSPKKTWEGFVGALVSTIVVAFYTAPLFARSRWLSCPATSLTLRFHEPLACEPAAVFRTRSEMKLGFVTLRDVSPIQLHAVVFGLFASVVAPFGGFLASAIKRAYEVKDFDSLIPGHGGVTDRVDCEFIMALFVYVYHKTFIAEPEGWRALAAAAARLPEGDRRLLAGAIC